MRAVVWGLIAWALTGAGFPAPAAAQDSPLHIHVPNDIVTDATSAAGAQVFFVVTVTDDVFAPAFLSCTGPSGSVFPVGPNTVACIALDDGGFLAQDQFTITVNPGPATSALSGALATVAGSGLDAARRRDLTALLNAIAAPASASRKCEKTDPTKDRPDLTNGKLGNRDSCLEKDVAKAQKAFADYVEDAGKSKKGTAPAISLSLAGQLLAAANTLATTTIVGATNTPPVLALAGDVTTTLPPPELIAAGSTSVLYTDRTNPPPTLISPSCSPPSGTQFPVGTTTITCTASTTGGTTTGSFTVTVRPRS